MGFFFLYLFLMGFPALTCGCCASANPCTGHALSSPCLPCIVYLLPQDGISALSRNWHREHFVCAHGGCLFEDGVYFTKVRASGTLHVLVLHFVAMRGRVSYRTSHLRATKLVCVGKRAGDTQTHADTLTETHIGAH